MKVSGILLASVVLVAGCGERRDAPALAVVGGQALTLADVKDSVLLTARMAALRGKPIAEKRFARWGNRMAAQMIGPLINAELLDQEIARRGIVPSQKDIDAALAQFNAKCGQKAKTVDELAAKFGDLEGVFRRQFERTSRMEAFRRQELSMTVSDETVGQFYALKTNELQNAKRVDALARRNAAKAYARLKAGEPWAEVAKASEDALLSPVNGKFSKDWIWLGEDALGIKELAAVLPKMKTGDYTEPIDAPDGMIIVRLEERNKSLSRVSRILFRMAKPVSMPQTKERARTLLADQFAVQEQRRILEKLQRTVKIDYPQGTNVNCRIWQERPSARKLPAKRGKKGKGK